MSKQIPTPLTGPKGWAYGLTISLFLLVATALGFWLLMLIVIDVQVQPKYLQDVDKYCTSHGGHMIEHGQCIAGHIISIPNMHETTHILWFTVQF